MTSRGVGRLAVSYFATVFAVGFVLGALRVIWLVPRLGERAAELAETPLMLAASFLAARFWLSRAWAPRSRRAALAAGALALALMLLVEFTVVLGLRGLTLDEYVATRDPLSGLVYAFSLLLFAAMPAVVLSRPADAGERGHAP